MDITKGQIQEIKRLVRAANRRLERATGGQEAYIKSYIRKLTGGSEKFSAAYKGLTGAQAAKKIEMLKKFMEKETTTTKTGWKKLKKESIRKANKSLTGQGYDLTDEELSEILEQIEAGSNEEFYRAVNLVTAEKIKSGENWEASSDKIAEVLNQKMDFQDALRAALKANPNLKPGGGQLNQS